MRAYRGKRQSQLTVNALACLEQKENGLLEIRLHWSDGKQLECHPEEKILLR